MIQRIAPLLALALVACAGPAPESAENTSDAAAEGSSASATLDAVAPHDAPDFPAPATETILAAESAVAAWPEERIALPPGFAPDLPSGTEYLRFAPGMFQEGADDYWSYAFAIRSSAADWSSAEALTAFLELYYDGLLTAVGGEAVGADPATVTVVALGDGVYHAQLDLIDAFVTSRPVQVHARLTVTGADADQRLTVEASPRLDDVDLWAHLTAAAALCTGEV